jgi:hypothetical protein
MRSLESGVHQDETLLTRTMKRSDTYLAVRRGSRFTVANCVIAFPVLGRRRLDIGNRCKQYVEGPSAK